MMKKIIIIALLAACSVFNLFGQQFRSPDGRLAVELSCGDGQPAYTLTYDKTTSIVSSSLGLVLDCADFSKNLSIDKDGIRIDTVQVEYSLGKIKKSKVSHKRNLQNVQIFIVHILAWWKDLNVIHHLFVFIRLQMD